MPTSQVFFRLSFFHTAKHVVVAIASSGADATRFVCDLRISKFETHFDSIADGTAIDSHRRMNEWSGFYAFKTFCRDLTGFRHFSKRHEQNQQQKFIRFSSLGLSLALLECIQRLSCRATNECHNNVDFNAMPWTTTFENFFPDKKKTKEEKVGILFVDGRQSNCNILTFFFLHSFFAFSRKSQLATRAFTVKLQTLHLRRCHRNRFYLFNFFRTFPCLVVDIVVKVYFSRRILRKERSKKCNDSTSSEERTKRKTVETAATAVRMLSINVCHLSIRAEDEKKITRKFMNMNKNSNECNDWIIATKIIQVENDEKTKKKKKKNK